MFDNAIQLDVIPTDLQLRLVDPARNMRRFFSAISLAVRASCASGAGSDSGGQMMIEKHADDGRAITALMKLAAVKRRRGHIV